MSGLLNKVKSAVSGDKHTSEARSANQGAPGQLLISKVDSNAIFADLSW